MKPQSRTAAGRAARLLVPLLLLTGARAQAATTWYVDGASSACSNSGFGSAAAPFCAIQTAAQRSGAGDTVLVRPALYREQVTPRGGSTGLPITYRATPPGAALVGSTDLSSPGGWSPTATSAWSQTFSVVPKQVFVDGVRLATATAANQTTPNSFFYDAVTKLLYVDVGGPNPADGHSVEAGSRTYGFNIAALGNLVIDGFAMRNQNSVGVRIINASSVIVRNVESSNAGINGIKVEASGGSAQTFGASSTSTRNGESTNARINSAKTEISTNSVVVERCNVSFAASNGILVLNAAGVTLRGNTSHDNGFHGISLQGSSNNLITDNITYANVKPSLRSAAGIDINFGSSANTIQANTSFSNQDSGMQIYSGSNGNLVVRNLSFANGDHGFDTIKSDGTRFISNTAYGNSRDGFSIEGSVTNTTLANNIGVDNGLTTAEFDLYVDIVSTTGFHSDHDLFWNSAPGTVVKFNNVWYPTLYAFSAATGQEIHGIGADPLFRNAPAADFRLSSGSPAIDSADSSALGFSPVDHDGFQAADDLHVSDTGTGAITYSDRGAFESDPPPLVELAVSPASCKISMPVTADASASVDPDPTPIATYLFDFGDGTTVGPQPSPIATHAYARAGLYTITATATDAAGGSSSATRQVTITDDPPSPLLSLTPVSGMVNLTVTADGSGSTDSDSTPVATFTFDFGDGTVEGPQASPLATHTYVAAGFYTVVMTVADTDQNTATAVSEVHVSDEPPAVALTVTPTSGYVNLEVTFDASASTDTDGSPIARYRFNFGEGAILEQASPIAVHTYAARGNYLVSVTVVDTAGQSAVATSTVTVTDDPPVAALTVTPPAGLVNLAVLADASASQDDDGSPIFSYTFDFGDGAVLGPQSAPTAVHVYRTRGDYTVRLTVVDTARLSSVATAPVTVTDNPPSASLVVTPSSGFVGLTATADASGSSDNDATPVQSYTFDFGDGIVVGPVTTATAAHTYRARGEFTVRMTVTDTGGQSSSATAHVSVIDNPPSASLLVTPSSALTGTLVTADASASRDDDSTPIKDYTFSFGDGVVIGPQAGARATHAYARPGTFSITVTVTDTIGQTATATAQASATDNPPVAAMSLPTQALVGARVTANAGSSTDADATAIASYTFDFGDGTGTGPQSSPVADHIYSRAGIFTVTVTVADTAGLAATATAVITITGGDNPPTAVLAVPSAVRTGVAITANASGSSDTDGTPIASYRFNFGDGTVVGPQTTATAAHSYTRNGTYTVTVTVTDTAGLSATASAQVIVGQNKAPVAALTVTPTSGKAPLPVTADASKSTDTDPWPIVSYKFEFGDGTVVGPQASPRASHTYATSHDYTLKVTVTDAAGLSSQASVRVQVKK